MESAILIVTTSTLIGGATAKCNNVQKGNPQTNLCGNIIILFIRSKGRFSSARRASTRHTCSGCLWEEPFTSVEVPGELSRG